MQNIAWDLHNFLFTCVLFYIVIRRAPPLEGLTFFLNEKDLTLLAILLDLTSLGLSCVLCLPCLNSLLLLAHRLHRFVHPTHTHFPCSFIHTCSTPIFVLEYVYRAYWLRYMHFVLVCFACLASSGGSNTFGFGAHIQTNQLALWNVRAICNQSLIRWWESHFLGKKE